MRTSAVVIALLVCPAARAQDNRAVYLDAVRTMMPRERYDQMIEMMYRPLVAQIEARNKSKVPDDAVRELRGAAESAMTYDELLGWTADAYQRRFTPDEMQQMVAFFRSPLGQKMEKEQPQVQAEVMRKVADVAPARMEAALRQEHPAGQAPPAKKPPAKKK